MSAPMSAGEAADASDDESFVSATAISPSATKPPPPILTSKSTIASKTAPRPTPKPKPDLAPKSATNRSVTAIPIRNTAGPSTRSTSGTSLPRASTTPAPKSPAVAPAAGPNSKIATRQAATTVPMLGLAASPTLTRTSSGGAHSPASIPTPSSTRPPALKPKPTIRLSPVSRSHITNNFPGLPTPAQQARSADSQIQRTTRLLESERYVDSPPLRTISKRYTTPPPGTPGTIVSQRIGSLSSKTPSQPIPISSGRPSRRPPSQGRSSYGSAIEADIHTPQPSLSGMSLDNLANAMVAGALATSAANSRSHSREIRPPPPPPARRSGISLLDKFTPGHSRHSSRAGSPEKGIATTGRRQMKMTLRDNKSGSDEEKDSRHGRHRKRNLVKKHPNKHHEGDRKRWRDVVTEKERKRYEGLWASNKGICIGEPVHDPSRWVNSAESQVSLVGSFGGSYGGNNIGSIQPIGTAIGGPGSFQSAGVGSYQGGPLQAPGSRVSPYMNPSFSQSQNQSLGVAQEPYSNSMQSFSPSQNQSLSMGPYSNSQRNFSQQSFATTSGSNSGNASSPQRQPPGRYNISPPPPKDCVSSLVVRDIWSRSRLPADVLREVWDLVDRSGKGMLCKDEFCAGLWLIDQRLKGRKLPQKVSDSVWRSLCGLSGVKIREFKGRDKARPVSGGR